MFGFRKSNQEGATPQADREEGGSNPQGAPGAGESSLPASMQKEARKLNLVGNVQMAAAVAKAVRRGLAKHFLFEEEQLAAAVTSIGEELLKQLKASSKQVRGLPKQAFLKEVEADKRRIEVQRERARKELESLLKQLQDRRLEFGKAEAQMVRESMQSGAAQDRALAEQIARAFAASGGGGELSEIQEQITALTLQTLQSERDKALDAQVTEHRKEVQNFERRISKLTNSLELTEEELRRIATSKGIDIGVGSIYRNVQGLSGGDADFEIKKELMSSIFEANLQLQKGEAAKT